ncbi:hypothetical protein LCGC14_2977150 [marine sediment metagenome]|uniref:Uncharacterized protein n=1 Tax=marine sediment metagenome TaxID=412755 RepID=A0A0F8ZYX6_9ZZZZ
MRLSWEYLFGGILFFVAGMGLTQSDTIALAGHMIVAQEIRQLTTAVENLETAGDTSWG